MKVSNKIFTCAASGVTMDSWVGGSSMVAFTTQQTHTESILRNMCWYLRANIAKSKFVIRRQQFVHSTPIRITQWVCVWFWNAMMLANTLTLYAVIHIYIHNEKKMAAECRCNCFNFPVEKIRKIPNMMFLARPSNAISIKFNEIEAQTLVAHIKYLHSGWIFMQVWNDIENWYSSPCKMRHFVPNEQRRLPINGIARVFASEHLKIPIIMKKKTPSTNWIEHSCYCFLINVSIKILRQSGGARKVYDSKDNFNKYHFSTCRAIVAHSHN